MNYEGSLQNAIDNLFYRDRSRDTVSSEDADLLAIFSGDEEVGRRVDLTEEEKDEFSKELNDIIDSFGYEWKLDKWYRITRSYHGSLCNLHQRLFLLEYEHSNCSV